MHFYCVVKYPMVNERAAFVYEILKMANGENGSFPFEFVRNFITETLQLPETEISSFYFAFRMTKKEKLYKCNSLSPTRVLHKQLQRG